MSATINVDYTGEVLTSGKGYELMTKMGYKPGQGIGANSDGPSSPISVTVKRGRAGIGAKTSVIEYNKQSNPDDLRRIRPSSYPGGFQASGTHWRDLCEVQTLTTALNDVTLLDPLRPTCRYDSSHRVPHLKALKKHELKCPARAKTLDEERGEDIIDLPSTKASVPEESMHMEESTRSANA